MAYYLLSALLSAGAFLAGRAVGRRGRWPAIAGYVVVLGLLLAKAVLNHRPDWEYALFPWPDYVFFQSWAVFPLALACLGLAVGLLKPGRTRRAVFVLAVFVFAVSLWTERWIAVAPDDSSDARAGPDRHCVQSTWWSCGPAACVSLLAQLGVDATEGEMMRLCSTPPYGGTSLFRICRGLKAKLAGRGYEVRIVDGAPDALRAMARHAIVSVKRMHAIAVEFRGDEAIVYDPAHGGPQTMPFDAYRESYDGFAVAVSRGG